MFVYVIHSEIQDLQRNVSSHLKAPAECEDTKTGFQCERSLDNGQYLDIRGVSEPDAAAEPNLNTTTTPTSTNTSTTATTTDHAAENSSPSTQAHSKFKSPSQHSKGPVQFDQPKR